MKKNIKKIVLSMFLATSFVPAKSEGLDVLMIYTAKACLYVLNITIPITAIGEVNKLLFPNPETHKYYCHLSPADSFHFPKYVNSVENILMKGFLLELTHAQAIISHYDSYKKKDIDLMTMLHKIGYNTDYTHPLQELLKELPSDIMLYKGLSQLKKYRTKLCRKNKSNLTIINNYIYKIEKIRYELHTLKSFLQETKMYKKEIN